jgi:hypothetical protein
MCSAISEEGEMGYPAKNRHPAAMAASAQASLPWSSLTLRDLLCVLTPPPWPIEAANAIHTPAALPCVRRRLDLPI